MAVWILRYLRGTNNFVLCFKGTDNVLQGYVDSDMAGGDKDTRKSTTGYVFTMGGTISWASKLQKIVSLSTPWKLNMWLLKKPVRKCCGWTGSLKSWDTNRLILFCIVIARVLST